MPKKRHETHTHTHLLTAQWKMRWALLETTQNGGNTQQAHVQFDTNNVCLPIIALQILPYVWQQISLPQHLKNESRVCAPKHLQQACSVQTRDLQHSNWQRPRKSRTRPQSHAYRPTLGWFFNTCAGRPVYSPLRVAYVWRAICHRLPAAC